MSDASRDGATPLRSIADSMPVGIVQLDLEARVRFHNRAFVAICSASDRGVGEPLVASVGNDIADAWQPLIVQALAGHSSQHDVRLQCGERMCDLLVSFAPLRDQGNAIVGAVGTVTDVSAGKQGERAKAESAARMRDQILAIVSHELRSPLNSVQSWSHVLENQLNASGANSPIATRALEGIRAGVEQQVRLIEHLLDASAAIAGELELAFGPIVARRSVEAAITGIRSAADAKDIALHVDNQLGEERMSGDAQRVQQVFQLLLTNAIKFTPSGGSIWLTATHDRSAFRVSIRDSGKGLASDFGEWLFAPFHQADSSNTRRSGGIGLGLALARKLAERHGGSIDAASAGLHLGATFTVTLPLSSPATVLPMAASADGSSAVHELAGLTALVIDDQLEAREALSALLVQYGARVQLAGSCQAGLAVIRHDRSIDVVICDIAMPEEDGYAFVKRLRAYEGNGGHVPVIALSAFAERNETMRSGGTTFDFFLSKPVSPQDLLTTIAAARRNAASTGSSAAHAPVGAAAREGR